MGEELEYSESDETFKEQVRLALAGLDATKIPDGTILQARDMIVVPKLNDIGTFNAEKDQENFDRATIMWTAELSFGAWLKFTRLRDREVETFIDPDSYAEDLASRTNMTLGTLGVRRPPDIPTQVITISHDEEKRRVDLDQEWVPSK